jgi:L-ascorbate peroxidase
MTALVDWTMLYAGVVLNFVTGIVNGTMKVLYWPTAGVGTSWTSFASADSAFWTGLAVLAGLFLLLRFTGTKFFNSMSSRRANYRDCLEELRGMIDMKNSHPILLRLAWSDAGTYDHTVKAWQQQGGANGSVRFESELDKKGNVGLSKAVALLESIKERYPGVTWADLIQMGGAVAVEISGGPRIDMVYGRVDALEREDSNAYGQAELPCPMWPYPDGAPSAQVHIRNTFYRMGLTNREIVALCGAHTLGVPSRTASASTRVATRVPRSTRGSRALPDSTDRAAWA